MVKKKNVEDGSPDDDAPEEEVDEVTEPESDEPDPTEERLGANETAESSGPIELPTHDSVAGTTPVGDATDLDYVEDREAELADNPRPLAIDSGDPLTGWTAQAGPPPLEPDTGVGPLADEGPHAPVDLGAELEQEVGHGPDRSEPLPDDDPHVSDEHAHKNTPDDEPLPQPLAEAEQNAPVG